jgi:hypothetical protein
LLRLPLLRHDERMLVMAEDYRPGRLSDAEMRAWVAAVRQQAASGALLAQSSSEEDMVRHLEEERRLLNR